MHKFNRPARLQPVEIADTHPFPPHFSVSGAAPLLFVYFVTGVNSAKGSRLWTPTLQGTPAGIRRVTVPGFADCGHPRIAICGHPRFVAPLWTPTDRWTPAVVRPAGVHASGSPHPERWCMVLNCSGPKSGCPHVRSAKRAGVHMAGSPHPEQSMNGSQLLRPKEWVSTCSLAPKWVSTSSATGRPRQAAATQNTNPGLPNPLLL